MIRHMKIGNTRDVHTKMISHNTCKPRPHKHVHLPSATTSHNAGRTLQGSSFANGYKPRHPVYPVPTTEPHMRRDESSNSYVIMNDVSARTGRAHQIFNQSVVSKTWLQHPILAINCTTASAVANGLLVRGYCSCPLREAFLHVKLHHRGSKIDSPALHWLWSLSLTGGDSILPVVFTMGSILKSLRCFDQMHDRIKVKPKRKFSRCF